MTDPTIEEILNALDPEWSSRWHGDALRAAQFYKQYSLTRWMETVDELRGLPKRNKRGETFEQFYERMQNEPPEEDNSDE